MDDTQPSPSLVDQGIKRSALCMNCLHWWRTSSKKESVVCTRCMSKTNNCEEGEISFTELFNRRKYVMCLRCDHIWVTKSDSLRIRCSKCGLHKNKGLFEKYFSKNLNREPDDMRLDIKKRFPKMNKNILIHCFQSTKERFGHLVEPKKKSP